MTEQAKSEELEKAFLAFTEMSQQLECAYRDLEDRVDRLNRELEDAREERSRQTAERKRLSGRLAGLLEALPGGVIVLDGDGTVRDFNPGAVELLGEPLEDQHWHDVTKRAFAVEQDNDGDVALVNGRRINIARRVLTEEPGQILLLSDVTESRKLGDLLDRHKRLSAMGEMAASLAHQIRTPLAAALLYASQFSNSDICLIERKRFADKTVSRLHHLERMVNDMLVFARGGAKTAENVPVRELIEEVCVSLEPQLTDGACLLVTNIPAELQVRGNREALAGALMNLATNALQAAGNDACLEVEVRGHGPNTVDILIRDNGPGIEPELASRIFEPFFTTRPSGTGLGLAVVKSVAKAHNGSVTLDSELGVGTTMGLRLPVADGSAVLPGSGHALPSNAGGKKTGPLIDGNAAVTVQSI